MCVTSPLLCDSLFLVLLTLFLSCSHLFLLSSRSEGRAPTSPSVQPVLKPGSPPWARRGSMRVGSEQSGRSTGRKECQVTRRLPGLGSLSFIRSSGSLGCHVSLPDHQRLQTYFWPLSDRVPSSTLLKEHGEVTVV